jgi:hypothetical protein
MDLSPVPKGRFSYRTVPEAQAKIPTLLNVPVMY